ncbi:MAG: hypothetical protein HZB31_10830 [Nitrospirae bacterium]|nr:hypothetical protein [Nitrospirota bacterium]
MRWLWFVLLLPALASAGEDCSMLNGICREVCAADETIEKGAFLDCSDKEECCVKKEGHPGRDKKVPLEGRDSDDTSRIKK